MGPDPLLLTRVLAGRSRSQRRDHWPRERMLRHQDRALARLRAYAARHSAFYQTAFKGLGKAPLDELPVLSKYTLMAEWDRICTNPSLRLADVEDRLAEEERGQLEPGRAWRGRWWVAATGGTTGRRAALAWDRQSGHRS